MGSSDKRFECEIDRQGVTLRLVETSATGILRREKRALVDVDHWIQSSGDIALPAIARLEADIEDSEDGIERLGDGQGYRLSHDYVSKLTDAQAASLGLPGASPYIIRLDSTGALIADDATVAVKFLAAGGKPAFPRREGSFLVDGSTYYRLPEHLYALLLAAEALSADATLDDRLDALAQLRAQLEAIDSDVSADQQLVGLKIAHAGAMSVQLAGGLDFDPILYVAEQAENAEDGSLSERDALLTPRQQAAFADAFRRRDGSKRTYLADDVFVYIDPALRVATGVVRRMQDASNEEKRRFVLSPHSFVRQELLEQGADEEFVDELVGASFVVTEELSARVRELGLWKPPVLPFRESGTTDWKTIEFGIRVGDKKVILQMDELTPIAERIVEAIKQGHGLVSLGEGRELPADEETLHAINVLRNELEGLPPVAIPDVDDELESELPDGTGGNEGEPEDVDGPAVLIVETNYDNESFRINTESRREFNGYRAPEGLINSPKSHQIEGIAWLQECWSRGYSGALLADDMGLGKTFQTLAFLAWLREVQVEAGKRLHPTLIVAPTTLLGTWQSEASMHLEPESLGEFALLYGPHLRSMKSGRQNDVTAGRATLNLDALRNVQWILTTYETMRDYHISLAQMHFGCGVFDEMQKLKNESSLMTNTSRALNIDFKIGLTGTPVENTLQDLWTIMDTLMPGALGLGSMKEFTQYFIVAEESDELKKERMSELNKRMTTRINDMPPPMLRRMKVDVAKDLPVKREFTVDRVMPQRQADVYHEALVTLKHGNTRKQKIEAFHRMRAVSLHPSALDGAESEGASSFVAESARLSEALRILDEIKEKGEKALVFVEAIEMHRWLSVYLQQRYDMPHRPERIYGQVSSSKRQQIVERFQSSGNTGFDVLLLSPKAAGVGLTLTAANNVIHLTRWWNPAVEDQCTDRAYRIGQTQDVNVFYPRALHPVYKERSFDGILHDLLERKRELSRHVLAPANADDVIDEMVAGLNQ